MQCSMMKIWTIMKYRDKKGHYSRAACYIRKSHVRLKLYGTKGSCSGLSCSPSDDERRYIAMLGKSINSLWFHSCAANLCYMTTVPCMPKMSSFLAFRGHTSTFAGVQA